MRADEHDRTTQDSDEHRTPRTRARRSTDQILDGWTWGRVIRVGTAIGMLWGAYIGLNAFIATKIATRQEMDDVVKKVDTLDRAVAGFARDRQLLVGLARMRCLEVVTPETANLTRMAGLPCDSLGIVPQPVRQR